MSHSDTGKAGSGAPAANFSSTRWTWLTSVRVGDSTRRRDALARQPVRVFITSTFRDLHAKRDHLVTAVFPEWRERIEQLGLEFFDVDLRWGVPAKDANGGTANSWGYCRQWIDRAEPFFVCTLGQCYGWVPEPEHFRDAADRQRQQREPRSITDLEVPHALCNKRCCD